MTDKTNNKFSEEKSLWLKIIWIWWLILGFLIGFATKWFDTYAISYSVFTGILMWWLWLLGFAITLWTHKTEKRLKTAITVWIIVVVLIGLAYASM